MLQISDEAPLSAGSTIVRKQSRPPLNEVWYASGVVGKFADNVEPTIATRPLASTSSESRSTSNVELPIDDGNSPSDALPPRYEDQTNDDAPDWLESSRVTKASSPPPVAGCVASGVVARSVEFVVPPIQTRSPSGTMATLASRPAPPK